MRAARLVLPVSISFLVSISLAAQQPATSSPHAQFFLQRSLSALAGGQRLTDITLIGTVRRIAGSEDETGTAVLKAASEASRVDLNLPSGQRTETLNTSGTPPGGSWSGPDGISHPISYHNLLTGPAWFFPAFTIAQGLSSPGYVTSYVGPEIHNGETVQHVSFSQPSLLAGAPGGISSAHLTLVDLYLDSITLLPSAIAFNVHPDDNALLDIPVEVRFTEYRTVNASQVAFHVQHFINNSLFLDFQFQTVTFNSGIPSSFFTMASGLQSDPSSVASLSRISEVRP